MDKMGLFLQDEAALYKSAAEKVAADPLIFAGLKRWASYDTYEKVNFLERYARLIADAFNLGIPALEIYQEPPSKTGTISAGAFDTDTARSFTGHGTIKINMHPDVLAVTSLESQLDTIAHEMTHQRQKAITSNPMLLGPEHRLNIAPTFRYNFAHYITPGENYTAYRRQPIEVHAFAMGELFTRSMMEFARQRQWMPNPYNKPDMEAGLSGSFGHATSIPMRNGIASADPYLYLQAAQSEQGALSQPRRGGINDRGWFEALKNYQMALKCGEFLAFDTGPALNALYGMASNAVFDEDMSRPSRRLDVPPMIQKLARETLEKSVDSPSEKVKYTARRLIRLLDKDVPEAVIHTGPKPKME